MRVYLDNCCLQRALDERTQFRVIAEAEAIAGVLEAVRIGRVELVSSDALYLEATLGSRPDRVEFTRQVLKQAIIDVKLSDEVDRLSQEFESQGLALYEALNLASAVYGAADRFCSCDDRLYRRCGKINTHGVGVVTPLELVQELGL